MKLVAIPAFTDNCIRMVGVGSSAAVVDPADSMPDVDMPAPSNPTLAGILVTRHRGSVLTSHQLARAEASGHELTGAYPAVWQRKNDF